MEYIDLNKMKLVITDEYLFNKKLYKSWDVRGVKYPDRLWLQRYSKIGNRVDTNVDTIDNYGYFYKETK